MHDSRGADAGRADAGRAEAGPEFARYRAIQEALRARVVRGNRLPDSVRTVAGADLAYTRDGSTCFSAVVVFDLATLTIQETVSARAPVRVPYVPGYLSFREIPALLLAFSKLSAPPDVIICDGQGRAHPRRFGLACHLGVLLDIPALGCGKTRLLGAHRDPGPQRGRYALLRDRGEVIGHVLRTQDGVKPLYVSAGHRIGLNAARRLVLRCAPRYRQPEPIRAADQEVNRLRRTWADQARRPL